MFQSLRSIRAPSSLRLCPTAALRPFFLPASLPCGGFCFPAFCGLAAPRYYVGSDSSQTQALALFPFAPWPLARVGAFPAASTVLLSRGPSPPRFARWPYEVSPGHARGFRTAPSCTTSAGHRGRRPLLPRRRGLHHHSQAGRPASALSAGSLSLRLGSLPSALRIPIAGFTLLLAIPPQDGRREPDFNR